MIPHVYHILPFVVIGLVWGITNVLIKRSQSIILPRKGTRSAVHWSFLVPQTLNLLGSAAFALLIARSKLSTAVAVANAASLCSAVLLDYALGEPTQLVPALCGIALVAAGASLCV